MRKLLLGETWQLPLGIALAVLVTVAARLVTGAGAWWQGVLLAVGLALALAASLWSQPAG